MARMITHRGTLWTLRRDGKTVRAEIREIDRCGLELRYTRDHKPFVRCIYANGVYLLREADMERFDLERKGWTADPHAAENAAQPNALPHAQKQTTD